MLDDDAVFAHAARFGRQDEFLALDRQHVAANDAGRVHPAGDADDEDDQDEDAGFRTEGCAQRVAEKHDDDQEQRQERQRQEEVGQTHQRAVKLAGITREHADQRSHQKRQGHGGHADGERDLSAGQNLGQHVLAEIVRAEGIAKIRAIPNTI